MVFAALDPYDAGAAPCRRAAYWLCGQRGDAQRQTQTRRDLVARGGDDAGAG